jgi:DNA-binding NtrC family response regulator
MQPVEIFAHSRSMSATLEVVRQAAGAHGGVLICGESGSGRRMVAREIHRLSASADAPFVAADCAEVEELEAALFGTNGAPLNGDNGRTRPDRIGKSSLLRQAVGGTLFLAHLPEMPARVQARLARVLRDGEVTVAESRRTEPVRLRLMASTDGGWDAAIAEGQIRSDLSRRCSASRIDVPPLRERREDIPALAVALIREVCEERRTDSRSIDDSAMSVLCAFPWRGNARELRALLDTMIQRSDRPTIVLADVLGSVRLDGTAKNFLGPGTLREARERFERDYIAAVLDRHRGRIGDAARALGIQRPNLYRKMRSLRLSRHRNGTSGDR